MSEEPVPLTREMRRMGERKRVQTAVRIEGDLHEMLELAAAGGNRSVGEEIRRRLWMTFAEGMVADEEWSREAVGYRRAWEALKPNGR